MFTEPLKNFTEYLYDNLTFVTVCFTLYLTSYWIFLQVSRHFANPGQDALCHIEGKFPSGARWCTLWNSGYRPNWDGAGCAQGPCELGLPGIWVLWVLVSCWWCTALVSNRRMSLEVNKSTPGKADGKGPHMMGACSYDALQVVGLVQWISGI